MARVPLSRLRNAKGQFTSNRGGVLFTGLEVMANNINKRGNSLNATRKKTMEKLAAEMEAYAKANKPWNNRTGDAQAGLRAEVIHDDAAKTSTVYLGHGVGYGLWLELGNYPIIMPTIMAFAPRMMSTIKELDSVDTILDRVFNGSGGDE